mgnify:CR=1 FL=1
MSILFDVAIILASYVNRENFHWHPKNINPMLFFMFFTIPHLLVVVIFPLFYRGFHASPLNMVVSGVASDWIFVMHIINMTLTIQLLIMGCVAMYSIYQFDKGLHYIYMGGSMETYIGIIKLYRELSNQSFDMGQLMDAVTPITNKTDDLCCVNCKKNTENNSLFITRCGCHYHESCLREVGREGCVCIECNCLLVDGVVWGGMLFI